MKTMRIISIVLCIASVPLAIAFGQITTNGTGGGAWSATSTWAGSTVPSGSETITILAGDSLVYDVPITITGRLEKNSQKSDSIGAAGSLTFGDGSVYLHSVNKGSIPAATWSAGSLCSITGIRDTVPSGASQNFYNFTYNCTSQAANLNLGWNGVTIGGDLNVLSTGSTSYQIAMSNSNFGTSAASPNIITINGSINISGNTYFAGASRSSGVSYNRVVVHGNYITDATCSFAWGKGSGCTASYWIDGDVTLLGAYNYGNTRQDTLVFTGIFTGNSLFTSSVGLNYCNVVVRPNAKINLASTTTMSSSPSFTLSELGRLSCSAPGGLSANITATTKILSRNAVYTFNGTSAQVTSTLLPDTIDGILIINNTSGVALSQATTVNGQLLLTSGILDNCTNNVTVAPANILIGSGSLACTPVAVEEEAMIPPSAFMLYDNYPNPFNPSTEIRFIVPNNGYTTLKVYNVLGQQVASLFEGYAAAGKNISVTFNASNMTSGLYFACLKQNMNTMIKKMALVK